MAWVDAGCKWCVKITSLTFSGPCQLTLHKQFLMTPFECEAQPLLVDALLLVGSRWADDYGLDWVSTQAFINPTLVGNEHRLRHPAQTLGGKQSAPAVTSSLHHHQAGGEFQRYKYLPDRSAVALTASVAEGCLNWPAFISGPLSLSLPPLSLEVIDWRTAAPGGLRWLHLRRNVPADWLRLSARWAARWRRYCYYSQIWKGP